jgi:hypothetical protein
MTIEDVIDSGKIEELQGSPGDAEKEAIKARQMEYVKGGLGGLRAVAEEKSMRGLSQDEKIFEIRALLESLPSIVMTVIMSQWQSPEVNIDILTSLVNVFDNILSGMVDHLERSEEKAGKTKYVATAEAVLEDVREVAREVKEFRS